MNAYQAYFCLKNTQIIAPLPLPDVCCRGLIYKAITMLHGIKKLQLNKITFNTSDELKKDERYISTADTGQYLEWDLYQDALTSSLEKKGSSLFFKINENLICKVSRDKYSPADAPFKWFCRDVLDRRLCLQASALREWRNNKKLASLGVNVVPCVAAGIACNPLNRFGSFLVMEFLQDAQSVQDYFIEASQQERSAVMHRIGQDVAALATQGYIHRDLHLGNVMIRPTGDLVWIDTHLRKLSIFKLIRNKQIARALSDKKLHGNDYRTQLLQTVMNALSSKSVNKWGTLTQFFMLGVISVMSVSFGEYY